MTDIYSILILFLLGCAGGFFAGLLGIGGGIVFIPVLTYFFKKVGITDPDLTKAFLANSFFAIIFSGISASYKQYRAGKFYPKQVIITSVGAVSASLLVSWLIGLSNWYSKEKFAVFFIAVLILLNIRLFLKRHQEASVQIESIAISKFVIIGIITGIFAALSGLGGGFIMVMLFMQWLQADIKQSTAVSAGTILLISIPLTVYYMIQQPVNFPPGLYHVGYIVVIAIIPMIAGVMLFTPLGVRVAHKSSPLTLKMLFIALSLVIIAKMLYEMVWH